MSVDMNMEEPCPYHLDTLPQCVLYVLQIIEPASAGDVDDQMHTRETQINLFVGGILADIVGDKRNEKIFRLGGA